MHEQGGREPRVSLYTPDTTHNLTPAIQLLCANDCAFVAPNLPQTKC